MSWQLDEILNILDVGLQQTFEDDILEGWCGPGVPIGGWRAYYEQWGVDIEPFLREINQTNA